MNILQGVTFLWGYGYTGTGVQPIKCVNSHYNISMHEFLTDPIDDPDSSIKFN